MPTPEPPPAPSPVSAPLHGLVLAGGFSTRMGRDKALLDYHGRPQALAAWELVRACVPDTWISCRRGQLTDAVFSAIPQLHDRDEGLGPMGGMLTAWAHAPEAAWLVVACDLPLLNPTVLRQLVAARRPDALATAYRSAHGGLPEPLCAIYEPAMRPLFLEAVAAGRQCPRKALIQCGDRVNLLDLPDADALENANDPAEAARLKAMAP